MRLHLTATETVEAVVVGPDRLVVHVRYAAASRRPPAHLHPAHDERFEVLTGCIGACIDGTTRVHGVGESFEAPRGTVHQMWPEGGPASARWECRPGERSLAWFSALDELHRRGLRGPARAVALAGLLGAHDDVFRLAVLPEPGATLLRVGAVGAALLTRGGALPR